MRTTNERRSRPPTATQVRNAASVLSRALFAEARRIRDEQGHAGHVAAQEVEHDAIRVGGMVARFEAQARGETRS